MSERQVLHQLYEDVGTIEEAFQHNTPPPRIARALLTPILRRWFVDQLLHRVQRLTPTPIVFNAFHMEGILPLCAAGQVKNWMNIVQLRGAQLMKFEATDDHKALEADIHRLMPQVASSFSTSKLMDQKLFFHDGRLLSRREMLTNHANKRGGVHLDTSRRLDEAYIDGIAGILGIEFDGPAIRIWMEGEVTSLKDDAARRASTYDVYELVAIDTAAIFANGIRALGDLRGAKPSA